MKDDTGSPTFIHYVDCRYSNIKSIRISGTHRRNLIKKN